MGKKVSKATKKFQSKHLKDAIDRRRKDKQQRKRIQGRRGNKTEEEKQNAAGTKEDQKMMRSANNEVFKDMEIEQYFEKGFEVPKSSKNVKKSSKDNMEVDSDSASDSEDQGYSEEDLNEEYVKENKPKNNSAPTLNIKKTELDSDKFESWEDTLINKPNLKVIKNLIDAFQYTIEFENNSKVLIYNPIIIQSPEVFQSVMQLVLEELPKSVVKLVAYKEKKGVRTLATGSNVVTLTKYISTHAISLIHLLSSLNDLDTVDFVLTSINELLPYIVENKKILKKLIKTMIDLWSTTDDEYTKVLIANYLFDISTEYRTLLLQSTLKNVYSSFVSNCRKINKNNLPGIQAQMESISDLFLIDETSSYAIGFEYIKQLALHLKNSMGSKENLSNEEQANTYKSIYNWQFVMSLDFWCQIIMASYGAQDSKKDSPIKELLYPLVQTMLGTIRLIPTPQFYPLRFHILRTLIQIISVSGTSIPIYPIINEILFSTTFTKQVRSSPELEQFDFAYILKCPIDDINSQTYQESVWNETVEILLEYLEPFCKHISFPELVTPIVMSLKRFADVIDIPKYSSSAQNLIDKISQNSLYIQQSRSNVNYNPQNTNNVLKFLIDVPVEKTPLGLYIKTTLAGKQQAAYEDAIEYLQQLSEDTELEENESFIEMEDEHFESEDDSDN